MVFKLFFNCVTVQPKNCSLYANSSNFFNNFELFKSSNGECLLSNDFDSIFARLQKKEKATAMVALPGSLANQRAELALSGK